jgi:hypothetical protein
LFNKTGFGTVLFIVESCIDLCVLHLAYQVSGISHPHIPKMKTEYWGVLCLLEMKGLGKTVIENSYLC